MDRRGGREGFVQRVTVWEQQNEKQQDPNLQP